MAIVTLSTSFNTLAPQDWGWDIDAATSTFMSITDGLHTQTFDGSFSYVGNAVSGSVNATRYYLGGQLVFTVTGMTAGANSASVLQQHAATAGDTQETYAYVLSGNDAITGSTGNDTILGYAGNDTLNGGGSADLMLGGAGNDVYVVDVAGDRVQETTTANGSIDAGGTDRVNSAVTFSLSATTGASFVENLTLTGTAAINGTGNALNNTIVGTTAANVLHGGNGNDTVVGGSGSDIVYGDTGNDLLRGGVGNDTLWGGAGGDLFRFDTAPNSSSNRDQARDFDPVADTFQLENGIFTMLGAGTGAMNPAYFKAITTGGATDANDYVVFNRTTGVLYYDATGSTNGLSDAVQVVVLNPGLALSSADFVLI